MKKQLFILLTFCLTLITVQAGNIICVHENVRETPYPQQGHTLYINPAPLLVPQSTKQSDYLQFNLSRNKDFSDASTLLSQPNPGACSTRTRCWKAAHGTGACVR